MRVKKLLLFIGSIVLILFACHKERSLEDNKQVKTDTLSADYPFATGYCNGGVSALGIAIEDTATYIPVSSAPLPPAVLLDMPAAGDQGKQGSCTAWATVYGVGSYYIHLATGKPYQDTGNLSPKFTYNQITKGNCSCTSFLDNLYLLKTQGSCSLSTMPYDPQECLKQPDSIQRSIAKSYAIKGWQKVNLRDLILLKKAIADKKPVLFAISVDDGFRNITAPYIWKEREGSLGQPHAMIIAGYDDSKNAFRMMNSWSTAWGDKGFAWIDYSFFLKNVLDGGYVVI